MDIDVFPPHELPTVFRALRTALAGSAALGPQQRRFLDAYAAITGHAIEAADPAPIDADDVHVAAPRARKRLVQLAALAALLRRPVHAASAAYVDALAKHLSVRDGVIALLHALARGSSLRARLIALRRALAAMIGEAHRSEGWRGVLRFLGALWLGIAVNRERTPEYRRLGLLPEGTLGREYWKHMTESGFGFPGERGGIPHLVAYHDVAHVLAGHEATAAGEILQGAFQGGNRRADGFFFIQMVMLQFHHGIRVTPVAPPECGHFDPQAVLWAIHRGARCTVDMTHRWDFWPLMALPIALARERCGVLPRAFSPRTTNPRPSPR